MEKLKFQLNHQSPNPLHHQVLNVIKAELIKETFSNSEGRIPTEKELSKMFNVSRITIRTALENLENEGIVNRIRGRGTFINVNRVERWSGQLTGFSETLKRAGFEPGAKTLKYRVNNKLALKVKEVLQLEAAWEIQRLRFADDYAIAFEHSYFPIDLGLEFEKEELNNLFIYNFLERNLNIILNDGRQTISAVNADEKLSGLLNIPEGEALLYVERLTCSENGRKIEFLMAYYRPD